jgi:Tol biopolymer transport system component
MALSPDGLRLAIRAAKANDDIHVVDLKSGNFSRMTFDGGDEWNPVWSADGRHLYYSSNQSGVASVYRRSSDGSGSSERVVESANETRPGAVTPDGGTLIYTQQLPAGRDLMAMTLTGERRSRPVLQTPYDESFPSVSADGEWLAFESNELGRPQVSILRLRDGSGRRQVSVNGGSEPLWSADGSRLYYLEGDYVMAASPVGDGLPRRYVPQAVTFRGNTYGRRYAVTRDGRVITIVRSGAESAQEIRLIVNWFELLKARVPVPQVSRE